MLIHVLSISLSAKKDKIFKNLTVPSVSNIAKNKLKFIIVSIGVFLISNANYSETSGRLISDGNSNFFFKMSTMSSI